MYKIGNRPILHKINNVYILLMKLPHVLSFFIL